MCMEFMGRGNGTRLPGICCMVLVTRLPSKAFPTTGVHPYGPKSKVQGIGPGHRKEVVARSYWTGLVPDLPW